MTDAPEQASTGTAEPQAQVTPEAVTAAVSAEPAPAVPLQPAGEPVFVPLWAPDNREFRPMTLSLLERKGVDRSEYHVYTDDDNFVTVKADSVIKAIESSAVANPVKVLHAHCRMPPIIEEEGLVFQGQVDLPIQFEGGDDTETPEQRASKAKALLARNFQNGMQPSTPASA